MSTSSNPILTVGSAGKENRPLAVFKPSPWTQHFLHITPPNTQDNKANQDLAMELKEELHKEILLIAEKPLKEQLCFIDSIERLGVAYHFEKEIDDALQRIHEMLDSPSQNLFVTSLRFRLLRQHGHNASSDVFKSFISSDGSLIEVVESDLEGALSLYEACHLRGHKDPILDQLLPLVVSKLESIKDGLSEPLKEQVSHALHKPLNKRPIRLESVYHIRVYEQDPSHHKTLLRFAKVDFNLLQSTHKEELSDVCRWWTENGVIGKLPLKDRIVECYVWGAMAFHEPQYSLGRKIFAMAGQLTTSLDDLYDAYGTPEELQIFTKLIRRWDKSCIDELPGPLGMFYELILDTMEELGKDLAAIGRSEYTKYPRDEMILQCEVYHMESLWRQRKYVPTLDEYMEILHRNIGYVSATVNTFLGMDIATHAEFEWICNLSKPMKAISLLLRILDDIGSGEVDTNRDHSPLFIEVHMKHYGVSYEQACKEVYEMTEDVWKDINEGMIPPREVGFPFAKMIRNMAHPVEAFYDGDDGFTSINPSVMESIRSLHVDPI